MVLLEALAAGLPVIANSLGAMGEMLVETPDLIVPESDVDAWAQHLPTLEAAATVDAAGIVNRSTYERRFQPSVALRKLEDVYASARESAQGRG